MRINGTITLPGDKSLSHRAAIFSSIAKGTSTISNYLTGEDTLNTLSCFSKLGVTVRREGASVEVTSPGLVHFTSSREQLDVGNSGTAARLLLGLFAGLDNFTVTINGDESLGKRPMARITKPLGELGARFDRADFLPIAVTGKKLTNIRWKENLGSAQVKSALLLAALASKCPAEIEEPKPSRDHTEKMLAFSGVDIKNQNGIINLAPDQEIKPNHYQVLSDVSSAAFFVVLALLADSGQVVIRNVLLNRFRDRYLNVLKEMGANIKVKVGPVQCGEQGGDIIVTPSPLKGITIGSEIVPAIIDELPILTIAGLFSQGTFSFRGAKELRAKESDRISAMCKNLQNLGIEVTEFEDGLSLQGNPKALLNGKVTSFHDHRVVMAFEVARLRARANAKKQKVTSQVTIDDTSWVDTSFPQFYSLLEQVKQ